jgi:hypothetical protein
MGEPVDEESSSSEEFEVEEIVRHRKLSNGKVEYLLKWKGFSDSENQWIEDSELNCKDLLEDYWEKQGHKPTHVLKLDGSRQGKTSPKSHKKKAESPKKRASVVGIKAACRTAHGDLRYLVLWSDGKMDVQSNSYLKEHYADLLLHFYEEHIALVGRMDTISVWNKAEK